jgi:hypothetical protein
MEKIAFKHKGSILQADVIRYDSGKTALGKFNSWPFYVVSTGEYESLKIREYEIENIDSHEFCRCGKLWHNCDC